MAEPENELKEKIRESGKSVLFVANKLKMPYGTLAGKLNGFNILDLKTRKEIEKIIKE